MKLRHSDHVIWLDRNARSGKERTISGLLTGGLVPGLLKTGIFEKNTGFTGNKVEDCTGFKKTPFSDTIVEQSKHWKHSNSYFLSAQHILTLLHSLKTFTSHIYV